jgi:hypothetical protein
MSEPDTERLIAEQRAVERAEGRRAREADLPDERRTHERRAGKAAYLEEKLEERAESEIRVEDAP